MTSRRICGIIYAMKLTRDEREMFELVGIAVAAVMATPIAIFVLVMLLSL